MKASEIYNELEPLVNNYKYSQGYESACNLATKFLEKTMTSLISANLVNPTEKSFLNDVVGKAFDTNKLSHKQAWAVAFQLEKLISQL